MSLTYSNLDMFIKHERYMDICWKVLKIMPFKGCVVIKAELWNQGQVRPWGHRVRESLKIKNEQLPRWMVVHASCEDEIRSLSWEPLGKEKI